MSRVEDSRNEELQNGERPPEREGVSDNEVEEASNRTENEAEDKKARKAKKARKDLKELLKAIMNSDDSDGNDEQQRGVG